MGLFGSHKPRITKREFKELRSNLAVSGFTKRERDTVEMIFLGDLHEERRYDKGIDREEAAHKISWIRENMSKHDLSEDKVSILEDKMQKYLD